MEQAKAVSQYKNLEEYGDYIKLTLNSQIYLEKCDEHMTCRATKQHQG